MAMSAVSRRRCPVCYRQVHPTAGHNIHGHWDSIGRDRCPGSGEPYDITIGGQRYLRVGRTNYPQRNFQVTA
jgi:hypothetical protein